MLPLQLLPLQFRCIPPPPHPTPLSHSFSLSLSVSLCLSLSLTGDDVWVPSELRRELKKQAKRGREQMPNLAAMAPVITPSDLWQGEKYREYSAMSSAYHVPMHVTHTSIQHPPTCAHLGLPTCLCLPIFTFSLPLLPTPLMSCAYVLCLQLNAAVCAYACGIRHIEATGNRQRCMVDWWTRHIGASSSRAWSSRLVQ